MWGSDAESLVSPVEVGSRKRAGTTDHAKRNRTPMGAEESLQKTELGER